jgi:hypothetical protein
VVWDQIIAVIDMLVRERATAVIAAVVVGHTIADTNGTVDTIELRVDV